VVAINGSHREGNTQFMVEFILKSLNKNPAFSTNQINLREKSIEYCNA
jgi:multimeric flavodoxin WrbA